MKYTLLSEILSEERTIRTYSWYPGRLQNKEQVTTAIYLLDGDLHYQKVLKALQHPALQSGQGAVLLVALGNEQSRARDYTPSAIHRGPFMSEEKAAETGGGNIFLSFLEQELMAGVEAGFENIQKRLIIGHSLGGLEVINILLKRPGLFDGYIAIEPSMWYDQKRLLRETGKVLGTGRSPKPAVFIAAANNRSKRKLTVKPVRELIAIFNRNKNQVTFRRKYYNHFQHFTVLPAAIADGIYWMMKVAPGRS